MTTDNTEQILLKSDGYVYEYGDKASRLLAHQLNNRSVTRQITQLKKSDDELTTDPEEISEIFTTYYSTLYTSESSGTDTTMEYFFNDFQLPSISTTFKSRTELPLHLSEIIATITSMQSSKTPGPDGYLIEFF